MYGCGSKQIHISILALYKYKDKYKMVTKSRFLIFFLYGQIWEEHWKNAAPHFVRSFLIHLVIIRCMAMCVHLETLTIDWRPFGFLTTGNLKISQSTLLSCKQHLWLILKMPYRLNNLLIEKQCIGYINHQWKYEFVTASTTHKSSI